LSTLLETILFILLILVNIYAIMYL